MAGGDRTDGRRRSEHPAAGSQLRMAARLDGAQLHGHAGVRTTVVPSGNGQPADVLGAVHQPVEHHVVHRRQVSELEEQPLRWCADDAHVAEGVVWPAVAG